MEPKDKTQITMVTITGIKAIIISLVLVPFFFQFTRAQSIELDKKLGAENAELVEVQMGIYDLETLTQYVRKVGNRLVASLENPRFEFQFHVVDEAMPNAFALPGGYVYVTRGVLSLITSEDELACVMGHEIIHVTKRHSIKQMNKSILPSLLELPGNIVGSVVSDDLGTLLNVPIKTTNALRLSSYGRKHETESDKLGVTLASKAGYDPSAMNTILDRLSKAVELLTNEKEKKSYFDSHPYTPDRIKNINKTLKKLNWSATANISKDFPGPMDGMIFGENPAKGVFQENKFLHPDLGFTITFPEDWETINQHTTVGGVHPERKAAIFLGLEDDEKSPAELGTAFKNAILQKHPGIDIASRPYMLNGNSGYLATIIDQSGSEQMYIHILWVKIGKHMFKLIGLAPTLHEENLKSSAESLRVITNEERNSIKKMEFEVATTQQNDTFEAIGRRLNSRIKPEVNAFLNGKQSTEVLMPGSKVKIIVEKDY